MSAHIRISVQPMEHPSKYDFVFGIPLEEPLIFEAIERLDFPSRNNDSPLTRMFCSPAEHVQTVMRSREKLATYLDGIIRAEIIKRLGDMDTIDGYDKQEFSR